LFSAIPRTNDVTQTALGMSRDDSGSFWPGYAEVGIVKKSPFVPVARLAAAKAAIEEKRKPPRTKRRRSDPTVAAVVTRRTRIQSCLGKPERLFAAWTDGCRRRSAASTGEGRGAIGSGGHDGSDIVESDFAVSRIRDPQALWQVSSRDLPTPCRVQLGDTAD
jgi:hypothetical protein